MSCAWQNLPEETTGKAEGKKDRQGEPRGRMAHTQIGKFATSSRGRRVEGGSGCAANVASLISILHVMYLGTCMYM